MKLRERWLVCSFLVASGSALAQGEIPDSGEYAWQFPISVQEPAEFFEAQIPLGVYRSVSDPGLRDLGVYDANGRAIPRMVQQRDDKTDDVEIRVPLGIIPLYGEVEQNQERLRLLMESSQAVTRLEFDSNSANTEARGKSLQTYIVDLRSLENETFSELEFEWDETASGFIGSVYVAQGKDLAQWRSVANGALAELEFENTRIQRNRIKFSPRSDNKFLRITWRDMPDAWRLNAITGIRHERGPDLARNWITIPPAEPGEDEREFVFDAGGYLPIDRLGLELAGQNVVVRAVVEFRGTPEASWRQAHQGLFYTVGSGDARVNSEPIVLNKIRAAQWRVRIVSGRLDGDVQLRLGWLPGRVLFLSQGEPPYTLVSGRAQDAVENFPHHRLLGDSSLFTMLLDTANPGQASIGLRVERAGAMAMEGARTWTWRTVLVWFGLFAAVAFVGWLVWSLLKENKEESG